MSSRYDFLLKEIDRIKTSYELSMKRAIANAVEQDGFASANILAGRKGKPKGKAKAKVKAKGKLKGKYVHWTQKPENKARLKRILKRAAKTRLSTKRLTGHV